MTKKIIEVTYLCGCKHNESVCPDNDGTFNKYLSLCKKLVCKDCFSEDEVRRILDGGDGLGNGSKEKEGS